MEDQLQEALKAKSLSGNVCSFFAILGGAAGFICLALGAGGNLGLAGIGLSAVASSSGLGALGSIAQSQKKTVQLTALLIETHKD